MRERTRHLIQWTLRTGVGVGALLLAFLIYAGLVATKPQVQPSDEARSLTRATVFDAIQAEVRRPWLGFGTVRALDRADVPARVTATVASIPDGILAGAYVEKGTLLVQLDASDFERQVEIAQQVLADLQAQSDRLEVEAERLDERKRLDAETAELQQDEYDRVKNIYDSGAGSRQGLDNARRQLLASQRSLSQSTQDVEVLQARRTQLKAQIASQEASLALAELNLERTRIVSPITGVLEEVDVKVGEEVGGNIRVARVVSLDVVEVPLSVPASAGANIVVGDTAELTTSTEQAYVCQASVSRIAPAFDQATRTMTVYAELRQRGASKRFATEGASNLLMPGAFVVGRVQAGEPVTRVLVPRRSVRSGKVLRVEDGVVRMRDVAVDFTVELEPEGVAVQDDQWIAVAPGEDAGLTVGDRVVLNISSSVVDGQQIQPVLPGP